MPVSIFHPLFTGTCTKEIEKLQMRVGFRVSAELKTEVLKAAGET